MTTTYRVKVPGSNSIYCRSYDEAAEQASIVMVRLNGFGHISVLEAGKPEHLLAAFEPYYGIVSVLERAA